MNVVDAVKIAKEGKYITRKYYKNYIYYAGHIFN